MFGASYTPSSGGERGSLVLPDWSASGEHQAVAGGQDVWLFVEDGIGVRVLGVDQFPALAFVLVEDVAQEELVHQVVVHQQRVFDAATQRAALTSRCSTWIDPRCAADNNHDSRSYRLSDWR